MLFVVGHWHILLLRSGAGGLGRDNNTLNIMKCQPQVLQHVFLVASA
jgi:hypothetical protein